MLFEIYGIERVNKHSLEHNVNDAHNHNSKSCDIAPTSAERTKPYANMYDKSAIKQLGVCHWAAPPHQSGSCAYVMSIKRPYGYLFMCCENTL